MIVWKVIKQKTEVSRCMVLDHNEYYSGTRNLLTRKAAACWIPLRMPSFVRSLARLSYLRMNVRET